MTLMQVQNEAESSLDGIVVPLAVLVAIGVAVLTMVGYGKARRRGEPTGRALRLALAYSLPVGGMVFTGVVMIVPGATMLWVAWIFWTELPWLFSPVAFMLVIGMAAWMLEISLVFGGAVLVTSGVWMLAGGGALTTIAVRKPSNAPPPPPAPPEPEPEPEVTEAPARPRRKRERPLRAAGR